MNSEHSGPGMPAHESSSNETPPSIVARRLLDNTEQGMRSLIFIQYFSGLAALLFGSWLPLVLGIFGAAISGLLSIAVLLTLALCFIRSSDATSSITKTHFENIKYVFFRATIVLIAAILVCGALFLAVGNPESEDISPVELMPFLVLYGASAVLMAWYGYRYLKGLVRLKDGKDYS